MRPGVVQGIFTDVQNFGIVCVMNYCLYWLFQVLVLRNWSTVYVTHNMSQECISLKRLSWLPSQRVFFTNLNQFGSQFTAASQNVMRMVMHVVLADITTHGVPFKCRDHPCNVWRSSTRFPSSNELRKLNYIAVYLIATMAIGRHGLLWNEKHNIFQPLDRVAILNLSFYVCQL